jgi:hypothetical protein
MLSIEYTHKRIRLFRMELNFLVVMGLMIAIIAWKFLDILRILF